LSKSATTTRTVQYGMGRTTSDCIWGHQTASVIVTASDHRCDGIVLLITHSHGSASVLKATKQVDGKGQNSTPRHTKTP